MWLSTGLSHRTKNLVDKGKECILLVCLHLAIEGNIDKDVGDTIKKL